MIQQEFKLIGLNRKNTTGIYGTVEYGKEDWFHADIDEKSVPVDRQYALFDYAKSTDNFWKSNNTVLVEFEKWSSGGAPVNPIIKGINIAEQ